MKGEECKEGDNS